MINYVNDEGLATAAAEIKSKIGSGPASAGGLQIEKYVNEQVNGCVSVSTLPYEFYQGSAVVLNGEIHILGSRDDSNTPTRDKYHYKYNGSSWVSVSTLPYAFYYGSAVVLNNEIHILGSSYYNRSSKSYSYAKYHYKYNGSSWVRVSTLPYEFYQGSAVVLNGEIHILGGDDTSYDDYHYKYNGSSWVRVSTLPYGFSNGFAVVLNNEIHILGSGYYNNGYPYAKYHYKYNGSSWVRVSTLPYEFYQGSAVVLNGEIHILGNGLSHYVFNGTSWRKTYDTPYGFYDGSAVVYNNEIHVLGGGGSGHYTNHFLIRPDNRHIATMLPKGAHIMLSDNEDINYVKNAKKASSNIAEVTENGYVEVLATLPEIDDIKGYLTFY